MRADACERMKWAAMERNRRDGNVKVVNVSGGEDRILIEKIARLWEMARE